MRIIALTILLIFYIAPFAISAKLLINLPQSLKPLEAKYGLATKHRTFITTRILKQYNINKSLLSPSLVTYYSFKKNNIIAFVDAHRVRTKNETILIVVDNKLNILSIQILSFNEPPEYIAPMKWLELFYQHEKVDAISGASLTSRASANAVKRVKLLYKIIFNK